MNFFKKKNFLYKHCLCVKNKNGDIMSIWNKDEKDRKIKQLDQNISVDTLIIGAGITGLTTAYYLKTSNICVVDASRYGHGVTLNTTAKITYLQGRVYTKIKDAKKAKLYLQSQKDAIKELINIIKTLKIDCDLECVPSYIFANTKKEVEPLIKEKNFLKDNHINIKEGQLPFKITSYKSFYVGDTFIFHPLKYLNGLYNFLIKKIPIYENTKILKIEKKDNSYICYSQKYHITAKNVVLACHYPFFLYPFFLPLKSYMEKSYMLISKVNNYSKYNCISSDGTYSTRFYKDKTGIYQICLAESHNTSVKQNDVYHFKRVKQIFKLNKKNIIMQYSNVDIMTPDYMPYIGKIKDGMYIGLGYNTWGMTNGVLAAKIISDSIKEKKISYQNIFDPKRNNFFKMFIYIGSQLKSYIGPKIIKNKSWYPHNVYIKDDLGIYIDSHLKKHIVYNKCPHLGCSLIFNEKEQTWDCPCHTSRFDIDGKCLKGPSKYDISYKQV